ncbi:hypothetical protein [Lacticaseibacillus daqingensis]|uniref:hypothetical protein n=1 Tax=Lacticaseibacillus daqingensis TaxID=2486014 RepID=UPI000F792CCA|nr:hypothetical protein [Lacticaseibacillus daqingensis]
MTYRQVITGLLVVFLLIATLTFIAFMMGMIWDAIWGALMCNLMGMLFANTGICWIAEEMEARG